MSQISAIQILDDEKVAIKSKIDPDNPDAPEFDICAIVPTGEMELAINKGGRDSGANFFHNPPTLTAWGNGKILISGRQAIDIRAEMELAQGWKIFLRFLDDTFSETGIGDQFDIPVYVTDFKMVIGYEKNTFRVPYTDPPPPDPDDPPPTEIATVGGEIIEMNVVDERYRLRYKPCTKNYNVRGQGDDYYAASLNVGVPWTWQEIITDLFAQLKAGTGFSDVTITIPETPPGVPENIQSANRSLVKVLDDLAEFNGWYWVWEPYDGATYGPKLVKPSQADNDAWDADAAKTRPYAVHGDLNEYTDSPTDIPGKVSVAFPNRWDGANTQWDLASNVAQPVYQHTLVEADETYINLIDTDPDQHLVVFDSVTAILPSPLTSPADPALPNNQVDLQARADFIGERIWDFLVFARRGRRIDAGFMKYVINAANQDVAWHLGPQGCLTVTASDQALRRAVPIWLREPDTFIGSVDGIVASPIATGRWMLTAAIPRFIYVDEPTQNICGPCP